ncbi:glycosyltransferase family 2 protein [Enterococcus hulanensis]|uniref:Glycosyltransferase family 2 protein n=1 Tax=Enterococcus hulanensis TaxID=2559929 RepID=A0ABU3EWM8_9ENTE|nr:glycosyltransferase family 2 protein [Enterococcus hulanensis]MDT2599275.1 glycosyltransferase family 2 protein [Enterococcus hulanensis]MDT2608682.1 glycosyltransferase family 2 protein [Enterococcus hulanensis]MDT2616437.1 glycosyltransferase family 2 protein [Enterococcus hulanensis]MDT2627523.1 glycosyltransferase family 2 protein [Enterococcus hulanensis]MDT2655553.1 glycosyltransferase family 2 protein [Enterococcus hulanensis]
MAKNEQVCIDQCRFQPETKQLEITGWALDLASKKVPTFVLSAENMISSKIEWYPRSDVAAAYKTSASLQMGFSLKLFVENPAEKITLDFRFGDLIQTQTFVPNENILKEPKQPSQIQALYGKTRKALSYLKRNGLKNTLRRVKLEQSKQSDESYQQWIAENENWNIEAIKAEITAFEYQPVISILMPVYNVEEKWLAKCIESVQNQFYPKWELCMADDHSTDASVRPLLEKYAAQDSRIKIVFRSENGHISKATNSALEIATGEFVVLLDNDDELAPIALYEVAKCLNKNADLDLIYSDEDKIDMAGKRFDPAFKPDWSPDLLLGTNYISHLGIYRRSIMEKIGGFRVGYEGSQDYDLVLRFTEQTTADRIAHIPQILYYWRILPSSTAADQSTKSYAFDAGLKAVQDAINRRGIKATVNHAAGNGLYDVDYQVLSEDLVSVIIPTRNGYDDVKRCVDSIIEKTTYPNYEIVMADNGSDQPEMQELYGNYQKQLGERFIVESIDIPFNYSRINNLAAKVAKGKYLLFLNNDTEVITPEWMTKMVSFAQFERIGCVGAKLYYPNNTIQHAGVILGMGGAAGHGHHTFPRGDFGYFGKLEINVDYLAVTAACMMIRAKDFIEIGGFNEELTVAFNDVDLCLKEYEKGHNNVWLHGAELYHFESQSRGYENTPEKQARFEKETKYMEETWTGYIENDPYYNPNLTRVGGDYSVRVGE